jgi:hypothetical protein
VGRIHETTTTGGGEARGEQNDVFLRTLSIELVEQKREGEQEREKETEERQEQDLEGVNCGHLHVLATIHLCEKDQDC